MTEERELPRYRCHKEVHAIKIGLIGRPLDFGAAVWFITPAEPGYAPIQVSMAWLEKHNPQVGGYYVVYADGYASFSPAKAFEEGYTLIV
jgi:hypothetical protein